MVVALMLGKPAQEHVCFFLRQGRRQEHRLRQLWAHVGVGSTCTAHCHFKGLGGERGRILGTGLLCVSSFANWRPKEMTLKKRRRRSDIAP